MILVFLMLPHAAQLCYVCVFTQLLNIGPLFGLLVHIMCEKRSPSLQSSTFGNTMKADGSCFLLYCFFGISFCTYTTLSAHISTQNRISSSRNKQISSIFVLISLVCSSNIDCCSPWVTQIKTEHPPINSCSVATEVRLGCF